MGGYGRRLILALAALACLSFGAAAAEEMRVYVSRDALDEGQARRLVQLLGSELDEASWTLEMQGEDDPGLSARVMADQAPQLAICAPGEAMPWAQEGLLLPLEGCVEAPQRIQPEALEPGMRAKRLYMAPLLARHRRVAVNRRMLEEGQFGYLLDPVAHAVWYPMELQQVLEEFGLHGRLAMDVWPAEGPDGEAVRALAQAIYGGVLRAEDGFVDDGLLAGLEWLADMEQGELIGRAKSRTEALERFLKGETALFIDWTDADEARHRRMGKQGPELAVMPYPSALGVPVRSFRLTGVCAFAGDGAKEALALRAVALLDHHAQAQLILGSREIYADDAYWLPCPDARGATAQSLLGRAIDAVIGESCAARDAVASLSAALDALDPDGRAAK